MVCPTLRCLVQFRSPLTANRDLVLVSNHFETAISYCGHISAETGYIWKTAMLIMEIFNYDIVHYLMQIPRLVAVGWAGPM